MIKTLVLLLASLVILPIFVFKANAFPVGEQLAALIFMTKVCLAIAVYCFIVSELTGNYSQVDKLWSIVPIFYCWTFSYMSHFNERTILMAILVTLWGARLTFNFWRRGGYSLIPWKGEEDYRWPILRKNPALNTRLKFGVFNLFFISLYQNFLILLFCFPIVAAWQSNKPLGIIDWLLALVYIIMLAIEFIADQQQYDYQTQKYKQASHSNTQNEFYNKGFTHTGLWAWVRHPNYAAEQALWVVFYLFSAFSLNGALNWSIIGCILLMLLFLGSSDFSEKISLQKYPDYMDYVKRVPRFWPNFKKYKA